MDYKRVLLLHFTNGLSSRDIAEATGAGKTTINEFLKRFRECKELSYPLPEEVTNEFIESLLYQKAGNPVRSDLYRDFDSEEVHRALVKKGETLKHLWKKYNAAGTVNGRRPLSYRQFCRRYTNWLDNTKVTFHIQRYPGVNLELDFAGKTLHLHDRHNPEKTTAVTIFVAALSFSDYFYIEGMTCCDISNWIRVNNNAVSYFGGITQTVTPDNCKVAVTENKDWINPSVNKDFQAWAEHNGTVIMPAKVRSPRWKPNVEGHVRIVTMHILIEMDEMTFYSLDELNAVLWQKMEQENRENFQGLSYSRRDLFENEEKEALLPLPETQYEYLERKTVKVSQDFSFTYDKVHYSMPRRYLKKTLEIRAGATKIYVYNENGDLIRTHDRSYTPKSWVVIPSDMPKEYGDYGFWNKPYFLAKAERVGPQTKLLIQRVIEKFDYPVQSFRSCFGILRFAERYGNMALEACCQDAVLHGKCNYTYISNTISMYADPVAEKVDRTNSTLKPRNKDTVVTGIYKDDDEKYSLQNLLKRQEEGDLQ
ncbi:MAG: IS21 family transposase [Candidatus Cryptobacteroides sp.]